MQSAETYPGIDPSLPDLSATATHVGLFTVVASGRELDMLQPNLAVINDITTIASSIAKINRFNGHSIRPYSVAEHSLLVAEILEIDLGVDVHGQFAGLMHDAHEAWTGDFHSPGKVVVGPAWERFERHLMAPTRRAFACTAASNEFAAAVKLADLIALATEKRDLMPPSRTPWPVLRDIKPLDRLNLNTPEREAQTWTDWRGHFIDRFQELEFARNDALFGKTQETQQ